MAFDIDNLISQATAGQSTTTTGVTAVSGQAATAKSKSGK